MRKTIVVNFVGLHGSGTTYAYEMTKEFCKNGCEVYAILSSKMENIDYWRKIKNLNIFEVKGYSTKTNFLPNLLYFYMFEALKIKKWLLGKNIDIVYIPMLSFWTWFVQRLFKKYRTFYTIHDVIPHDNKRGFIWWTSDKTANECSDIVILSDCFRKTVEEKYNKPNSKIYTLPIGSYGYYSNNAKSQQIVKYNQEVFNYIFFGIIEDYKGLDVLANAFQKVYGKRKDVALTIVGRGDFSPYRDLYKAIGCSDIKIINRWIEDEEVAGLFMADKLITVLPYKNATQSGVIPVAMHMKSPVIATRCSGLCEQIEDGVTGYLVEPNDADALAEKMIEVIENWESVQPIIENAYNHIESLSWDKIAQRLIEQI